MKNKRTWRLVILMIELIILKSVFSTCVSTGPSMLPTLPETPNWVLIFRSPFYEYRPGDIVVAVGPDGVKVVKRIKWIKDDKCFIAGDNQPISYDSFDYGPIPTDNIFGFAVPLQKL